MVGLEPATSESLVRDLSQSLERFVERHNAVVAEALAIIMHAVLNKRVFRPDLNTESVSQLMTAAGGREFQVTVERW